MYPWQFFWAPQLHLPWSGNVAQRITSNTDWFSDLIEPGAGDPLIEEKAFQIASYGKQLGIITEVLLDLSDQLEPKTPEARKALNQLKQINQEIGEVKSNINRDLLDELVKNAAELKKRDPEKYREFQQRLEITNQESSS